MPIDPFTGRCAAPLAGAVAAGIWALQQPLDQKLFGVRYDDTELLGKLVTRGSAWPAAGTALHLAQRRGVRRGLRAGRPAAAAAGLGARARGGPAEHFAQLAADVGLRQASPRARRPAGAGGNRGAFAQATWRHLLFGTSSASSSAG